MSVFARARKGGSASSFLLAVNDSAEEDKGRYEGNFRFVLVLKISRLSSRGGGYDARRNNIGVF